MEEDNLVLRKNSVLFWCALVVPLAIIAVGINFIFNPIGASIGYGIPNHDANAFPYMWVKGIRDILRVSSFCRFCCEEIAVQRQSSTLSQSSCRSATAWSY
jgi:hypothetical protein